MEQQKKYDIFISYRRTDTGQRAEHLKDLLENDYKDRVSFDRENLTGLFDVELARRIDSCVDFLLLIDEESLVYSELDNSDEKIRLYNYLATASIDDFEAKIGELGPEYPLDFVRIEIGRALHRRDVNIIPIVPETSNSFNFSKLYLPKDIVGLKRYEAIFFSKNKDSLFKDILNKLCKHLKTSKISKKHVGTTNSVVYKIRVNCKCALFIDDEYIQDVDANKLTKISLPKGEYLRKVVDKEDENVFNETEIQLVEGSKLDDIQLNRLHEKCSGAVKDLVNASEGKIEENRNQLLQSFQVNGVSFNMIKVIGGKFTMGATDEQGGNIKDQLPAHRVILSDYYIGETPVTQELWNEVMDDNPSCYKGPKKPVEMVSWNDCQEFVAKLNKLTGGKFRLPTEAEWEFAARGGVDSKGFKYAGSDCLNEVAWYAKNSDDMTHEVKTKTPNELGLYDMNGNVWEWCSDYYSPSYYSVSPKINPQGPITGSSRVNRGGSWFTDISRYRISVRDGNPEQGRYAALGLRLAMN